MNLEEIKEDRKYEYAGCEYTSEEIIDWLIAEVERLEESRDLHLSRRIECEKRATQNIINTATRCAEIADNMEEYAYADEVGDAIRKEFS